MNPLRTMVAKALGALYLKAAGGETYSLTDAALGKFFGSTTTSGKTITETSMMTLSAAWGCCRVLTETIGAVPWDVFESDGKGNFKKTTDHPVADVLTFMPNANMTPLELKETKGLNLCQNGNAYSFREFRPNGDLISTTPIPSSNVDPKQRDDGTVYYRVLEGGQWTDYPQEKIWHVKGFGNNGLIGLSPIGAAREAMGVAMAMDEFGARFFSQGGMPSGIVTVDKFLNDNQRAIARENLQQLMNGLGNAHKFALFEGGMKPEPWAAANLDEMQFILGRKFSIQEICRFYRVPPHMVADLDRATFSNIEQMSLEFIMYTMLPYFRRFEESASRWLFKAADRRKFYLRFNYEGLLRADSAGRATFLSQMLQNGVMSRNEVRGKEMLSRSEDEGMDDFTVQVNLTPVEQLAQVMAAKASAPAPSFPPVKEAPELWPVKQRQAGNTFNLTMPETVKQHLTQRVEVPGVAALADAVKDTAERGTMSNAALIGTVMKLVEGLEASTEELKTLVTADREVIFDAKGEPIGTRLVKHVA